MTLETQPRRVVLPAESAGGIGTSVLACSTTWPIKLAGDDDRTRAIVAGSGRAVDDGVAPAPATA